MEITPKDILVYVGFAILIIALILFLYRKDILYTFKKKKTEGVIVNWMAASEKGIRYYYPMIEFSPDGITQQTFRAEERCEGQPMFPPGTRVTVFYLPADTEYRKVVYPS
jgi:hypothetical protein